jgi:hypothetical protein
MGASTGTSLRPNSRKAYDEKGVPVCQCQTAAYAKQILEAVNFREAWMPTIDMPRKRHLGPPR